MLGTIIEAIFLILLIIVVSTILILTHAKGLAEIMIFVGLFVVEIIGLFTINFLIAQYVNSQIKKISSRYNEDDDMGAYLDSMEKLESLFKYMKGYRFTFANNKSYAYAKRGDYETALTLLREIDPKVVKRYETLYYANMAACAYRNIDGEFATECVDKINDEKFTAFKNSKRDDLRRLWYFDMTNYLMYKGEQDEAKKILIEFYNEFATSDNNDSLKYLQKKFPQMFEELDISL